VTHVDSELLAGQALGLTDEFNPNQLEHLATCPQCRAEVDELSRIAELSRDGRDLARPIVGEQALWRAISDELGLDTSAAESPALADRGGSPDFAPTEASKSSAHDQVQRDEVPTNRPAPRRWMLLLAAAVGLIMGVGVTAAVNLGRPDDVEIVSSTTLTALPGETGAGQAQLVRDQGATALQISVEGSAPSSEYREVWLINNDGKRMYSLGVLPPTGSGTYPVPDMLGSSLDGFTIVDVSLEPYDGNAAHSLKSQVRGTLPL
jgi:anti-sigma-K factor RskA